MNPSDSSSNSTSDSEVEQIVDQIVTKMKIIEEESNDKAPKEPTTEKSKKKVKMLKTEDVIKDKPKRLKK